MTKPARGADALVRTLEEQGIDVLFSLSGNHIMPVYDAAFGRPVRIVHTRHEAAAVHMADAWARLTGRVGVALVSAGQGHANAVAALCTSLAAETPLVLISGHAPLRELGNGSFQEQDQAALAAPTVKSAWVVQSPDDLADDLIRAMRIAAAGRPGPVQLNVPSDVLDGPVTGRGPAAPATPPSQELAPDARDRILGAIGKAQRPVVLAPPALCTPHGRRLLHGLREALGLPVIAMESPRGVNDPSQGALSQVLRAADLVLLLGKQLDFTLRFGDAPFAASAAWIVLEPEARLGERARRMLGDRLALLAAVDAFSAADALSKGTVQRAPAHRPWLAHAEALLSHRPQEWDQAADGADGALHPVTIGRAVQAFIDRNGGVLVADGGEFSQWAQALVRAPERLINGPAGAIGPAVPFAIGASLARPDRPVVAMLGDGTFGFHMAEFETALRHDLPFIAIVGNDSRWNAEYQIQCRDYGRDRAHACTLPPDVRYDLAVAALGAHGELVTRAEDLPAALERAHGSGKAACLNVRLSPHPAPVIAAAEAPG
ncbi:MAG: thiamine pyrophosphate-binding protein [Hyphomicrobiaceae bacterium]|nr:thiamine pyrophosphate-binding protein [Hyphomicrobiaceae bacterium]